VGNDPVNKSDPTGLQGWDDAAQCAGNCVAAIGACYPTSPQCGQQLTSCLQACSPFSSADRYTMPSPTPPVPGTRPDTGSPPDSWCGLPDVQSDVPWRWQDLPNAPDAWDDLPITWDSLDALP
jgi:hypothetical protein